METCEGFSELLTIFGHGKSRHPFHCFLDKVRFLGYYSYVQNRKRSEYALSYGMILLNFLFYPLRIEIQFLAATSHDLPMIAVHVPLPDMANENGEAKRCQFLGLGLCRSRPAIVLFNSDDDNGIDEERAKSISPGCLPVITSHCYYCGKSMRKKRQISSFFFT